MVGEKENKEMSVVGGMPTWEIEKPQGKFEIWFDIEKENIIIQHDSGVEDFGSVELARDKTNMSNARDKRYKQNFINKMGSPPSAHLKEGTKPSHSGGEPTYFLGGDDK